MNSERTITVLVPAYNEEENLEFAVKNAVGAIEKGNFKDYEILILDAFSSDNTGKIADNLALKNKKIKVIHRDKFYGFGANYMEAVKKASMEYFTMFPGDNENTRDSFIEALQKIGKSDIIITYTLNKKVRALHRRIISKTFVLFLNKLFNLKLKYYNGNSIHKTEILKNLKIKSQNFAFLAEILIKLLKSGRSYTEVGFEIKPTKKTVMFEIKNIVGVFKTIATLFYEVNIKERGKYQNKPILIE